MYEFLPDAGRLHPLFLKSSEPMFTELHLTNFKNFCEATLELGPFTVLVGANASGKSNLRDAFRFLHGMGRGYDFVEILEEKYSEGSGERTWNGIRGGAANIVFSNQNSFRITTSFTAPYIPLGARYTILLENTQKENTTSPKLPRLLKESLSEQKFGSQISVFKADQDSLLIQSPEDGETEKYDKINRTRSLLSQRLDYPPSTASRIRDTEWKFKSMRFLDLDPKALRQPSKAGQTTLGDRGQNLASVLMNLCEDKHRKSTLVDWVETLTPMDAKDFEFDVAKHSNEVTLVLVEKDGTRTPMQSASDGTLRFLGLLALLFQEDPPQLLFIEEIETGLHPTRLDLLANLIEQRTAQTDTQVIATTHSPQLLDVLGSKTLEDAQLVYRTGDGPEAKICPLLDVPTAQEVLAKPRQNVGELHRSGWFERTLAFSGGEAVGS